MTDMKLNSSLGEGILNSENSKRSSENSLAVSAFLFSDDLLSFKALTVYSGHFSAGLLSMTALNWF